MTMDAQQRPGHVMIAIDDHPSNATTLEVGLALAHALEQAVAVVHVVEDAIEPVRAVTEHAGVELQLCHGPVVPTLTELVAAPEVAVAVVGSGEPGRTDLPAGHVAVALIEATTTPTLLVPAATTAGIGAPLRTVLLPLDGAAETEAAVAPTVGLLAGTGLEVVVVHVLALTQVPAFLDQAHHDLAAWGEEFLARHRVTEGAPRIVLRSGAPGRGVLDVAAAEAADLIVLGWSQDLSPGRAEVVRLLLGASEVPMLLVPVDAAAGPT
ncbi:MAG: universal stress protein [Nitriliruptor sp.]|nr:MAG: universal stress protein [Nitriliruptor sp.]